MAVMEITTGFTQDEVAVREDGVREQRKDEAESWMRLPTRWLFG